MTPDQLRAHLLHHHGRCPEEVDRLPADDLHRLEHVEQELGLVLLDHDHTLGSSGPAAAGVPAPRTPEPAGTPTPTGRARLH
jgi:hypothetical protein